MLMTAKSEISDLQQEHQREMEGLLDAVRETSQDLQLYSLICDSFVPKEYLSIIEEQTYWNDDIGEWQLVIIFSFII